MSEWIIALLAGLIAAAIIVLVIVVLTTKSCATSKRGHAAGAKPRSGTTYIVVKNENPEGGYGWFIFNVLNMLAYAEKHHLKPIVLMDSGLYLEKRKALQPTNIPYDPGNWFNNYFEAIGQLPTDATKVQEFTRTTWQKSPVDHAATFPRLWDTYFKPLPYITQLVDDFKQKHRFSKFPYIITMHYRGTDKRPGKTSTEDNPISYDSDFCVSLLREELKQHPGALIFVASDEQPFVEIIAKHFPDVAFTPSLRATISTSGLEVNTSSCEQGKRNSPECKIYNDLIEASVHRGMPDKSKHQKGVDVLLDMLLLAEGDVFFKSRGNVSNLPPWINTSMRVVDMVNQYAAWKKHNGDVRFSPVADSPNPTV